MPTTESAATQLGASLPDFALPDTVSGQTVSDTDFPGKRALLIIFLSRHCPYVQHVVHELAKIGSDYASADLGIVAISSNDIINYPDDAPDQLADMATSLGFTFPLCFDESQDAARAFGAACTPEFFLYDQSRTLVYHGQLDDSRPGNGKPVTGADVRAALDAVLAGRAVDPQQRPSVGCSIKWKS